MLHLLRQGDQVLLEAIYNGESPSVLETLTLSLTLGNELASLGNTIRIKNHSAQALNDPAIMREGLELFNRLNQSFNRLNPLLPEQYLPELESAYNAANVYKANMESLLETWLSRAEIDRERGTVADNVQELARITVAAGMEQTRSIARDADSSALDASNMLTAGLIAAVLIGLLLSVALTRSITLPLAKGVNFAAAVAGGDLDHMLDVQRKDELGKLADALNSMVSTLKQKINEALEATREAKGKQEEAIAALEEAEAAKAAGAGKVILSGVTHDRSVRFPAALALGADLVVGSLIKNPGGGLAPTGGYIAGRRDLVEGAAMRLTCPGIGGQRLRIGHQPVHRFPAGRGTDDLPGPHPAGKRRRPVGRRRAQDAHPAFSHDERLQGDGPGHRDFCYIPAGPGAPGNPHRPPGRLGASL